MDAELPENRKAKEENAGRAMIISAHDAVESLGADFSASQVHTVNKRSTVPSRRRAITLSFVVSSKEGCVETAIGAPVRSNAEAWVDADRRASRQIDNDHQGNIVAETGVLGMSARRWRITLINAKEESQK